MTKTGKAIASLIVVFVIYVLFASLANMTVWSMEYWSMAAWDPFYRLLYSVFSIAAVIFIATE